jgi:hypothetical protein
VVEVDHTPPVISALTIRPLWTEDQPFVFFATDDLARGDLLPPGGGDAFRRITGAYRTQGTLRSHRSPAGLYGFGAGATNAALSAFPVPGVAPISHGRCALANRPGITGRRAGAGGARSERRWQAGSGAHA